MDEIQSSLLQALASGGPSGPANTQELLAQLGAENPRVAAVLQYMARRQAERAEAARPAPAETEEDAAPEGADLERLQRLLGRMAPELEALRERNDRLAAALGACYLCWGEDAGCPVCRGRGHSGARLPDRHLFAEWVAPAIRRLRAAGPGGQPPLTRSQTPDREAPQQKGTNDG